MPADLAQRLWRGGSFRAFSGRYAPFGARVGGIGRPLCRSDIGTFRTKVWPETGISVAQWGAKCPRFPADDAFCTPFPIMLPKSAPVNPISDIFFLYQWLKKMPQFKSP
ncbi:hypothetical protein MTX26_10530 [Bradyrhizobium sp. ISRA443]|uniref:hypothetical protein n=1 Tax=unclassified Bradyrhizobium TaxID=2631580 RepID=UPI00247AFF85|nr:MULTISPECIES: hypothetical protein [unclassified Bradyrhizobium]WGR91051.1 hypothetical protein MTX20_20875 [Bradyrhizobium sp. ISRA435]WGS01218.1 hypothetical protein MTX23_10525 [Bradyrhizobium sp. ISRA436]WGS08105.1 hypothetical protein MTX18_10530 [Bradyrhizobium sp. ISRA437]WGS14993.1 hypothetical protein MTX26_10530 [Bradyrhizobium sp. ISRA443]